MKHVKYDRNSIVEIFFRIIFSLILAWVVLPESYQTHLSNYLDEFTNYLDGFTNTTQVIEYDGK